MSTMDSYVIQMALEWLKISLDDYCEHYGERIFLDQVASAKESFFALERSHR